MFIRKTSDRHLYNLPWFPGWSIFHHRWDPETCCFCPTHTQNERERERRRDWVFHFVSSLLGLYESCHLTWYSHILFVSHTKHHPHFMLKNKKIIYEGWKGVYYMDHNCISHVNVNTNVFQAEVQIHHVFYLLAIHSFHLNKNNELYSIWVLTSVLGVTSY